MPRPQRLEYENAVYHVMNRGKDRQTIFHGEVYFHAFLDTLAEVHRRFNCIVHAYCLMGNHYHLLIETPDANLSRIMRHVNGVYTQRYNRLRKANGPLFRGRYKALLVDQDAYLLQLSRYIHRNPIDMKRPLVDDLLDYPWSSYPAYVNKAKKPKWLFTEQTYQMLDQKQRYSGYASYVSQGVDVNTLAFYNRGNFSPFIGDGEFREWVYTELLPDLEALSKARIIQPRVSFEALISAVAIHYKHSEQVILKVIKGPTEGLEARKVAMYLCQELGAMKLVDIAPRFGLRHIGSVSFATHYVRKTKRENLKFSREIDTLVKSIMSQVT